MTKKILIAILVSFFLFFSFQNFTLAAGPGPGVGGAGPGGANPVKTADIHDGCDKNSISTAIGCISVLGSQEQFLGDLLRWGVGIGGGIAFLLIIYAGFMVMSSAGNPDRLKAGQELMTSAISGLLLLIFSVFILKFIGIDILGLYNFGFGQIKPIKP